MNLDRMSRRSLLGTGALLTIEKAIGPTSAAQAVDTKEATVLQESLIVPWKLQASGEALADLRERLRLTRFPDQLADVPWVYGTDLAFMRRLISRRFPKVALAWISSRILVSLRGLMSQSAVTAFVLGARG
jgi:hypothetical protein